MAYQIPEWIKKRVPTESTCRVKKILDDLSLNTVCESAVCPNIYECFSKGYATFMILGNRCTRNCRFCGVSPLVSSIPPDKKEPEKIANAVKILGMRYVVITSPTRDDLPDGGAEQFALTVKAIKETTPETRVEVLIPDFKGKSESIEKVFKARPDVISHNIETVPSLYPSIRPSSDYKISMDVLRTIKENGFITKSGFMLGLGEKKEEVLELLKALKDTGCEYIVIGQYLRPSKNAVPVKEFFPEEVFKEYEGIGRRMGFKNVYAGVFYRSSYLAEQLIQW